MLIVQSPFPFQVIQKPLFKIPQYRSLNAQTDMRHSQNREQPLNAPLILIPRGLYSFPLVTSIGIAFINILIFYHIGQQADRSKWHIYKYASYWCSGFAIFGHFTSSLFFFISMIAIDDNKCYDYCFS